MKKYAVQGLTASGTANKTAVTVICTTTIRTYTSEFSIGFRTNPNATDQQVEFGVGTWTTSAGTAGSAPTPKPLDKLDPIAAISTTGITHSAEPTYDATFFFDGDLNQRGFFRWVAEIGFELAASNVATTGVGIKMIAVANALAMSAPIHFKE